MEHWLIKSEPDVFSIDDLARDRTTTWEGVRNFTARNSMRDGMRVGLLCLYYHSNAEPSGVVGIARVSREAYPDPTQFDPKSEYHDETAPADGSRWLMVEVEHVETFPRTVSLEELKAEPSLATMLVVQKGQRLSVMPVDAAHFATVVEMSKRAPAVATKATKTKAASTTSARKTKQKKKKSAKKKSASTKKGAKKTPRRARR